MRKAHKTLLLLSIVLLSQPIYSQEKTNTGDSPLTKINIRRQPTALLLDVRLQDANGNQAIDAEKKGSIEVTLKNNGPGKAYTLEFIRDLYRIPPMNRGVHLK